MLQLTLPIAMKGDEFIYHTFTEADADKLIPIFESAVSECPLGQSGGGEHHFE